MPRLPLLTLSGDCRQRSVDQSELWIGGLFDSVKKGEGPVSKLGPAP